MDRAIATASITVVEEKSTGDRNSLNSITMASKINMPSLNGNFINHDQVRVVPASEYKQAALSLAEAFREDEVARYFVDTPDLAHWTEEQKWQLHCDILEYITYAHCLKGLVTTVGPDYGAVALWMPPGKNMDDLLTIFRSGMWRLNYKLSAEGKKRFFNEFLPLLHDVKASVLGPRDDQAWYLVYIGCRPSARGKGYARKLIDHISAEADAEGRPCYLESSNEVNVKIYGRMGFEVKKNIHLQRAEENITLDIMVREPKRVDIRAPEKMAEMRTERI